MYLKKTFLFSSTGYKENSLSVERATWVQEWHSQHRRCSRWQMLSNTFNGHCCHLPNGRRDIDSAEESLRKDWRRGREGKELWHATLCSKFDDDIIHKCLKVKCRF